MSQEVLTHESARIITTSMISTPTVGAAATISLSATTATTGVAGSMNVLGQVAYSYTGTAVTGGSLIITNGTTTLFSLGTTALGPNLIKFSPPISVGEGLPLTITLASGGAGVTGTLNITTWVQTT